MVSEIQGGARKALLKNSAAGATLAMFMTAGGAFAQSAVDITVNQPPSASPDYALSVNATAVVRNEQVDVAELTNAASAFLTIVTDLEASGGADILTGTFDTSDNSVYAETYVNLATNTISVETTPSFDESSAIGNLQVNGGSGGTDSVTAVANGAAIQTIAEGDSPDQPRTLTGTVTMDGNEVTSLSQSNVATNTLTIADAISVGGSGDASTVLDDRNVSGGADLEVDGDLVIASAQTNYNSGSTVDINAVVTDSEISAFVHEVDGGTVILSADAEGGNQITASARGNNVTSTIDTGENAADIDAAVALASLQRNQDVDVDALVDDSTIAITAGTPIEGSVDNSTLTLDQSRLAASSYGSTATQTLSLDANSINGEDGGFANIGSDSVSGDLTVTGEATVANLQMAFDADVTGTVSDSTLQIWINDPEAGGSTDNTVTLSNSVVDATAVNNRAISQAVSLTGNEVGAEVAVANEQLTDSESDTTAQVFDTDIQIDENSSGGVSTSTLTLADSTMRALAIGNASATKITIDANDVALDAASGGDDVGIAYDRYHDFADGDLNGVVSSYASLNEQFGYGDVTATVDANSEVEINVSGSVAGSTVALSGNDALAAAISNDAANTISLTLNNLVTTDPTGGTDDYVSSVATAASYQQVSGATVTAQALPQTEITIGGALNNSDVQTTGNSVETLAIGNRTTDNTVTVDANALTAMTNLDGDLDENASGAVASLLATGMQTVDESDIVATLTDDTTSSGGAFDPTDSTEIETIVALDVTGSDVGTDGNILRATATGNDGVNGVIVTAGTSVASSTGVQNFQTVDDSTLAVSIGAEGTEGFDYDSYTFNGSTSGVIFTGVSEGEIDTYQQERLDDLYAGDINYSLTDNGDGTWTITRTDNVGDLTQVSSPGGTVDGEEGVGGVFVRLGSGVFDSTVSVDDNIVQGLITGNTAVNTLSVTANAIDISTDRDGAYASDDEDANADNMLQSSQYFDDATATSVVTNTFAIDLNEGETVSGSTLTIEGNAQLASVIGNEVTSTLSLDANDVQSSAALQNDQTASGSFLSAESDMLVYAPFAVTDSTLSLSENVNEAVAQGNLATTTLNVDANAFSSVDGWSNAVDFYDDIEADAVVYNDQFVNGTVTSTADTMLYNEHLTSGSATGILNSTVSLDANRTVAVATGNEATQTISIEVTDATASAGLGSEQNASGVIAATATADIAIDMSGIDPDDTAMDASTALVDDNVTNALATANSTVNALSITGTNLDGDAGTGNGDYDGNDDGELWASYGVSNYQDTDATVTASTTSTVYGIVLNDVSDVGTAASTSTLSVSGNQANAQAIGNLATNRLTVDVTNSSGGTAYGLGSMQYNDGDGVTASVTGVEAGITAEGYLGTAVLNSSLSVDGNRFAAFATGNSSTNTLVLNASNLTGAAGTGTADGEEVTGDIFLFNIQENDAAITARVENGFAGIDLDGFGALNASMAEVTGNTMLAQAVGNATSNMLTVSALAGDTAGYAIDNIQTNSAQVVATVTTSMIGVTTYGGVTGSSTSVTSNTIGSTAVGNTATNVLRR